MYLVICNNTKENFLWEPKKTNVKFHKNCENTGNVFFAAYRLTSVFFAVY